MLYNAGNTDTRTVVKRKAVVSNRRDSGFLYVELDLDSKIISIIPDSLGEVGGSGEALNKLRSERLRRSNLRLEL